MSDAPLNGVTTRIIRENERLVKSWEPYLNESSAPEIKSDWDRTVMAMLLQNIYAYTQEGAAFEAATLNTNATTGAVANSLPQVLGMARTIVPRLIMNDIATLFPVTQPNTLMYRLKRLRDDGSEIDDYASWAASKVYANHAGGEGATIQKGTKIEISQTPVTIDGIKKLIGFSTLEAAQDMRATHNMDLNELLRSASVDEITRELDGEVVAACYAAGAANLGLTFGGVPPTGQGWTYDTWRKRLQRAILQASAHIYDKSGEDANFIVAGINASLELMDLNDFKLDNGFNNTETASFGLERVGTLSGRLRVFRSRYVPTNDLLVGRKGTNILDAGVFLMAYILLFVSELQFDAETQKFLRSLMSRYKVYRASDKYFARITIDAGATGIA